jgi:hypothetical protein
LGSSHDYKRTTWGRAKVLLNNARKRCRDKNVSINLSTEWIQVHLEKGTCQITGMPFSFEPPPKGLTRRPDAPSLDRINKNEHYTEDNSRVILWAVNCALSEYGTENMLPILKAMVKGIEDAQAKSTTSVSAADYIQGAVGAELGSISTPWTWEDSNDAHHHCGADARKDIDSSTQASSRNSVGCGDSKVGTSMSLESEQDNWLLNPTYGWIER